MSDIKYFNRWGIEGIQVKDPGLVQYITVSPMIVPKTGARYAKNRFHKSKATIVERFMNKIMVTGHKGKKHTQSSGSKTGKAQTVLGLMEQTLEAVEKRTKQNPILVLVAAIENAAPREEIVTIEYGGARYPKAVECSPQRRVDVAIRNMTQGASQKAFASKKSMIDALTEEIVAAFNLSNQSAAVQKKFDLERQADSSR
ncbi:MAG TPA: 30S ribosomal protein S7 [Acidobacteriota bacterium]|nr:30S ribosomal protein S7 [Acidobacteriota bacterium]